MSRFGKLIGSSSPETVTPTDPTPPSPPKVEEVEKVEGEVEQETAVTE